MTLMGMNKEEYITWRMDAYECSKEEAERFWNRNTEKAEPLTNDEILERMSNAML